jgi:hypothetical protein
MRLNLYRSGGTMRYTEDGLAVWYVVDEDAPGANNYQGIYSGSIVDCAKFIQDRELAEQQAREDGFADDAEAQWVEASSHPSYHSNVGE